MMHANGSWRDVLIDAAIAAGSAFFGVLIGVALVDAFPEGAWAAGLAAAVAFFASLGAARRPTPPRGEVPLTLGSV